MLAVKKRVDAEVRGVHAEVRRESRPAPAWDVSLKVGLVDEKSKIVFCFSSANLRGPFTSLCVRQRSETNQNVATMVGPAMANAANAVRASHCIAPFRLWPQPKLPRGFAAPPRTPDFGGPTG